MSRIPLGSDSRLAKLKLRFDTRAQTGNKAVSKFLTDKAHYWPVESLPFAYAMACVQVVILHGKADKQYQEAKEAWGLPDCVSVAEGIVVNYFDLKEIVRGCPSLFNNLESGPDKYAGSKDFLHLINSLCEFIKIGFNREIDRANEVLKVLPDADSPLFKAVIVWTLADYLGIKLEDWAQYRSLVRDGKVYDTDDIMTNKPTHRIHRELVSLLKGYGKQVHDGKLLDAAEMWHRARVLYNTLREAADYYHLDPIDLSKRIEPYDDATGWPRHK
jgi:hypothetical protein